MLPWSSFSTHHSFTFMRQAEGAKGMKPLCSLIRSLVRPLDKKCITKLWASCELVAHPIGHTIRRSNKLTMLYAEIELFDHFILIYSGYERRGRAGSARCAKQKWRWMRCGTSRRLASGLFTESFVSRRPPRPPRAHAHRPLRHRWRLAVFMRLARASSCFAQPLVRST